MNISVMKEKCTTCMQSIPPPCHSQSHGYSSLSHRCLGISFELRTLEFCCISLTSTLHKPIVNRENVQGGGAVESSDSAAVKKRQRGLSCSPGNRGTLSSYRLCGKTARTLRKGCREGYCRITQTAQHSPKGLDGMFATFLCTPCTPILPDRME